MTDDEKMMAVFEQYLFSDLNEIGGEGGEERADIAQMHSEFVKGPLIAQMDEVVDVSTRLEDQAEEEKAEEEQVEEQEFDEGIQAFQETFDKYGGKKQIKRGSVWNRMLKLSLTDGSRRFFAMEYRYCPMLSLDMLPGTKISLRDVLVRRGVLLLVPECVQVLGGSVENLVKMRARVSAMRRDASTMRQGASTAAVPATGTSSVPSTAATCLPQPSSQLPRTTGQQSQIVPPRPVQQSQIMPPRSKTQQSPPLSSVPKPRQQQLPPQTTVPASASASAPPTPFLKLNDAPIVVDIDNDDTSSDSSDVSLLSIEDDNMSDNCQ